MNNFYDQYHKKNDKYYKKISFPNFTYYYILQFLQKVYRPLLLRPAVLDIGCGVGTISLFLSDYSRSVIGIDVSQRAINIANGAINFTNTTNTIFKVGKMANFKKTFDVICLFEVIEHVEDDRELLNLIHSSLNDNGVLVLSTPLLENRFVNTNVYKKFDSEVGHLRRYTAEGIVSMINNNGFTVTEFKRIESPMRNILYVAHLDFIIRLIRGPLIVIFHFIDELLINILGASNIILIAKKKS